MPKRRDYSGSNETAKPLTLLYVQSAARFQALPGAAQKLVVALANQAISRLAQINASLTPAQVAKLADAYKLGVAVLRAGGMADRDAGQHADRPCQSSAHSADHLSQSLRMQRWYSD
jgi:hypothetical protein